VVFSCAKSIFVVDIQNSGIAELAPTRRGDVARLGLGFVLSEILANLLNAAIAAV